MDNINHIKGTMTAAIALMTALWGWFGWLIVAWVFCMAMDVFTGMGAGMKNGEWSSRIAREGLWHKAGCVAAVTAAGILDLVVGQLLTNMTNALPFTYTVLLCPLVVVWYILTEVGSITENAGKMGAPVPGWLAKAIVVLKDKVDSSAADKEWE